MPIKRAYHEPISDPCVICDLPAEHHRGKRPYSKRPGKRPYVKRPYKPRAYYVGIDGEGQGKQDHRYVMLAWSDESGKRRNVIQAKPDGRLTTVECLDFMLSIPNNAKVFAFSFGYDLTKILTDVDDDIIYKLFRPETRKTDGGKSLPVAWNGYTLDKISSKFTVSKGTRSTVIWDIFAFYQAKFTAALSDWKVGEKDVIDRMIKMKDQRGEFDELSRDQILAYCYDECGYMATLARKLTDAHNAAGLHLTSYFGAGSTATAMLKKMGLHNAARGVPDAMEHAVSCGFFGGRFENRVIGPVAGPVRGLDISSAYPYQITFLPCLGCGAWELTDKRVDLEGARAAIVNYTLEDKGGLNWGPFPFRMLDGSIAFPAQSGGGWVWLDEYLQGERLFPGVGFRDAWVYKCDCNHQPFAELPTYYKERLRIGKEGPGIVIKLGCNSIYGKTAQGVGTGAFRSWAWAGMITSGCRAQLLEVLGLHRNWDDMLMTATDGIYTRDLSFIPPAPRDTNTLTEHKKPLGGWEEKIVEKGIFAARPGIYFPLDPTTDEIKQVRARGVGRGVLYQSWQKIVAAQAAGVPEVEIADLSRFHGAKPSITYSPMRDVYTRSEKYGEWETKKLVMSFDPLPKRERINPDNSLEIRRFPLDLESAPYERALSVEAHKYEHIKAEISDQPDGPDYADYG